MNCNPKAATARANRKTSTPAATRARGTGVSSQAARACCPRPRQRPGACGGAWRKPPPGAPPPIQLPLSGGTVVTIQATGAVSDEACGQTMLVLNALKRGFVSESPASALPRPGQPLHTRVSRHWSGRPAFLDGNTGAGTVALAPSTAAAASFGRASYGSGARSAYARSNAPPGKSHLSRSRRR